MVLSIDLVYPHLPPAINGIGDHSAILAKALVRRGHRVRLLGALGPGQADRLREELGVEAIDGWPSGRLGDTAHLTEVLLAGGADVVLLQFEQFSYGTRGWNPSLARLFGVLAARMPAAIRVLYAHENYTYADSPSHAVMWAYQRRQFRRLVRDAQRVLVTTEAWAERDHLTDAVVVPVFSNLPDPADVTSTVNDAAPVTWFGYLDDQRLPFFERALRVLQDEAPGRRLVYVGVNGALARAAADRLGFDGLAVVDAPPADEVSRVLLESGLVLAPFPDGVSSRRGTVMAALQHGRSVVTNSGPSTDEAMRSLIEAGVLVAAEGVDPNRYAATLAHALGRPRREIEEQSARAAAAYDSRFAPDVAVTTLIAALES